MKRWRDAMTDLITAEDVERILNLLRSETEVASRTDAADMIEALHAELAQARADAKAAVGLAIERAEVAAKNVATGFHDGISGDWHPYSGLTMINETCKAIRALAPEDAIAEVAKLRAELDAALSRRNESERVLVGMTLELEVFTAEVARLRDRERVLVGALINRDGGSHDEDCKARRYGNSDRLCNCGHDEVVAALATDASAKAGGE